MFPSGIKVIGRITNAAVDTATEIVFTNLDGIEHVFAPGDRLVIQDITANNRATAKVLTIFQDADGGASLDAGEEMAIFSFAAAGTSTNNYMLGLGSNKINADSDNFFYAVASTTGAVDILVNAEVIRS